MAEDRRRLVAILAADVVGYSRLIGADEAGTLARLRVLFAEAIRPVMREHGGRIFKLMGDAFLAEFGSAVEAVRAAAALQSAIAAREAPDLRLRIGVHLGDVVVEGSDLLGDGVNIAARLEGEAEPGGVAVSAAVAEAVRGRVPFALEERGERTLKNIDRPLRVFRLAMPRAEPAPVESVLALPDKPSLVVLPFQNMSGDAEQDYFVDGLVEDITTALSCIRSFFVIARNSAFTYKGRAVDVRQVGRELGVRYVLEGSVRKAGGRIRITGQLIDATTGAHLWADRFDGAAEDVFALQDRVTEAVAGAIEPSLTQAEIARAERKPTRDLGAYDLYLRGIALINRSYETGATDAQALFLQATARDPHFGAAWGMAAMCFNLLKTRGRLDSAPATLAEVRRVAGLAAEHGQEDAQALARAAGALAYACMEPEAGLLLLERACILNPNSASCWMQAAIIRNYLGDPAAALAASERALRLSPRDPQRSQFLHQGSIALVQAGRVEEAVAWAQRAVAETPNSAQFQRTLAASLAMAGRIEEARQAMAAMCRLAPDVSLSTLDRFRGPYRSAAYAARLAEAYR
ncbi:MAG: tetratricopeptide repeat protein, partial [Acetobacteraceae bacterium]|nr:tetratricopeptide repeat protein [Acetobacteraceae bacterium]